MTYARFTPLEFVFHVNSSLYHYYVIISELPIILV